VFGGIREKGQGEESHFPLLASPLAEVYDPKKNVWEDVTIDGAISLSAFGYTPISEAGDRIIIVGGSDGGLLQD
jgi:N-acetylneuraminic acid mutarotase